MAHTPAEESNIETVKEYFRRVDAGSDNLADLFTDDVEVYFPKFGIASGKAAFTELATGLLTRIGQISHDVESVHWVANDNDVIAEGTSSGTTQSGASWTGGRTPGGRFCNVVHFRDGKIDRLHIHLDPDYVGEHQANFLWGSERRW